MDNTLTCSVNIEWQNNDGSIQRKNNYKTATLKLFRNENRQMFIEISVPKVSLIKLEMKNISVFKKFMNEGKSSIKFPNCMVYLSNAPPGQLLNFLKTIFIKMSCEKKDNPNLSLRTQLLSNKQRSYEEISPVTNAELMKAKKLTRCSSDTTPTCHKKRKLSENENIENQPLSSRNLYNTSPSLNEPLTIEQKEVMEACLEGRNVFFTGSAGTGKSYLLRKIIGALPPDVTFATASTGVAACHIGGITIHKFAGIGPGDATLERCIQIASKPAASSIWRKCKHLIIDEISMIDADYFEKIEAVARIVRRNEKPFGGIHLILCGDFFQLPPVNTKTNKPRFCFQTKVWNDCVQLIYELKQVHRQNDEEFIRILNSIRLGKVTDEISRKLKATHTQKIEKNGILATRLCSHTNEADSINESKLNELEGEKIIFKAEDSDPHLVRQIDQQTQVISNIELKVGAQVMLLKNINISLGLVNGARGVIKSFTKDNFPMIQFRNREHLIKPERWTIKTPSGLTLQRKQIPLRLAWAFSIHKSQGLSLDCVEMSLGRVFEAGQAYVALSRAQSLETLRILDFKNSVVWANPDVLKFYNSINLHRFNYIALGRKIDKEKNLTKRAPNRLLLSKPLVTIN